MTEPLTAEELDSLSVEERRAALDASIVRDPFTLPPEVIERAKARMGRLAQEDEQRWRERDAS